MSVAFTREEDLEATAADLPDRPISPHPNLVTPKGLALIEAALASARAAYSGAQAHGSIEADRTAMARATRDLRYWSARRWSKPSRRDASVSAALSPSNAPTAAPRPGASPARTRPTPPPARSAMSRLSPSP
ncbi:MAG: GreA/GreB family elongation factor [bacterium]|nr:MAG: GreA/GreB family elongation factor [bacterium]